MPTQLCTPEGTPCLASDGTLVKGRWGLMVLWARGGRANRRLLSRLAPTLGINFAHTTEGGEPIPCHDQGGRVAYAVFGDEFSTSRLADWFGLDSPPDNPLFGLAPEPIIGVQYATDSHVCAASGGKPKEKPVKAKPPGPQSPLHGIPRKDMTYNRTDEGYVQRERFWRSQD